MGSNQEKKPHVVCIPVPVQGHINPMLKLAKILHSKGCEITFVNTEFNHQRLLRSRGSDALRGFPSFRFETISDGLQMPQNPDATQDVPALARALEENCLDPFRRLITKVNASYSPVTCIVADVLMSFTLAASKEFDIPEFMLWTSGAGSFLCFDQYPNLLETGLMPLKDPSFQVNGYLDTIIDSIPTMSGLRLKDIPPWIRYIHPGDEYMVEFFCLQMERAKSASAIFCNTFHELDNDILDAISLKFAPCYGIGPLHLLEKKLVDKTISSSVKSNLWKEESECLNWLDSKAPLSVIYVNFGSITVMTPEQLVEFGWGLAKSNYLFLWIIRPDLVIGESDLPPELLEEISDRGLLASWCPQEQVLTHPSIGGFLTHGGWNSTIESISSGVPMVCWPFFGDQQPNCWMGCNKWGIAMEINNDVKRDEVAKQVLELMNGEKGNEMRKNVIDLKKKAEEACGIPSGSSMANLDKLIHLIQTSSK